MSKNPIPRDALDQNAIVLGKTRSGKSSALRFLIEGVLEEGRVPPCLIDPKGDWWGIKLAADGRGPGFPLIIFGGAHADIEINDRSGAYIAELVATGNRPCLIDLGGWRVKERTRFFIDFASTLFRTIGHPIFLMIDECHNFAPKGKLFDPEAAEMLHWANRLASEGLGKGIMLLSASQRPQKVHNDYLTSHETLIAKRVIHKADRDALKDWIDGCGDPALGKEVIGSIAQMQRAEAWAWSPEIGFGPKRIEFPFFKTYDSFKPQSAQVLGKLKGWASVDLDDVREKLKSVVEEAKENDPKALKARIKELTSELAQARLPSQQFRGIDPVAVEAAEEKGLARGREEGFLVGHHIGSGLAQVVAKYIRDHIQGVETELLGALGEGVGLAQAQEFAEEKAGFAGVNGLAVLHQLKGMGIEPKPLVLGVKVTGSYRKGDAATGARPNIAIQTKQLFGPPGLDIEIGVVRPPAKPNGNLDQRILDGLAELLSARIKQPERGLLAFIVGYAHPNTKTFKNALGALRSSGLIEYPGNGTVTLSAQGAIQARSPERALTAAAFQARLLGLLDGVPRRILERLITVYPNSIGRDGLAEIVGYAHPNTKTFKNALGRLRGLGLADYPSPGDVAATGMVFLEDGR